jgi:hypothetical protein
MIFGPAGGAVCDSFIEPIDHKLNKQDNYYELHGCWLTSTPKEKARSISADRAFAIRAAALCR